MAFAGLEIEIVKLHAFRIKFDIGAELFNIDAGFFPG